MPNLPNFRRQAMGDVVPAMLEPGEFVINRKAVNALGVDNLEVLNDAGGAHSAIDSLIASATVANSLQNAKPPHFQEGGEVRGNRVGGPAGYPIPDLSEFTMNRYADVPGLEEFTMNRFVESLASKGERGLQDYYQGIEAGAARGEFAPSIQGRGGREFSAVPETPQRNWQISGPEYPGEWQVSGPGYQEGGEVGMGLENFISRIAGEREDVTRAGIRDIMNRVAFHESAGTGKTDLAQYGGGPGRGVYQFERGAGQGGATAGNRLATQLGSYDMKVPKWLESFNKSGKGDVSGLTRKQQDMLFVGNMMQHPQANMGKVESGEMDLADFWQKYHQAGGEGVRDARMASFEKSMGKYPGMQQGGQVEQLEYREPPVQGNGLMGMSNDRRVMPVLPPDEYVMRQENGEMLMSKQQVPKLSPAYMASFGMETPLSKRQRSLLQRRAINPESISPQLHGLLGKVLLQRLENEPE